ncbi:MULTISPECIES: hypothetical protein [Bacillus amyloliquefaciens group]|uniref:hypothetical protein n=1 Tax=Bacillus amyloliquefaciens group TaxID=1938374 RepID=UPI002271133A|nr:hypothetical protein [Bacillus velezensis]MCY0089314.1 hypothetical protein [Bacillus velezensis]
MKQRLRLFFKAVVICGLFIATRTVNLMPSELTVEFNDSGQISYLHIETNK